MAPLAVKLAELPLQIVALAQETVGREFTVTLTVMLLLVHPVPLLLPVILYVFSPLTVGLAVTMAPVVALKRVAGDQL